MPNTHSTLAALFSAIASSIRAKTGGSGAIVADNFPAAINGIVTLADGTEDATATANDIANGKTAYAHGAKITGTAAMQKRFTVIYNVVASYGSSGSLIDRPITNIPKKVVGVFFEIGGLSSLYYTFLGMNRTDKNGQLQTYYTATIDNENHKVTIRCEKQDMFYYWLICEEDVV